MAEWSNAANSKFVEGRPSVGSNPTLSVENYLESVIITRSFEMFYSGFHLTSLAGSQSSPVGERRDESQGQDSDTFISHILLTSYIHFVIVKLNTGVRHHLCRSQRSGFPRLKNPALSRKGNVGSMSSRPQ